MNDLFNEPKEEILISYLADIQEVLYKILEENKKLRKEVEELCRSQKS